MVLALSLPQSLRPSVKMLTGTQDTVFHILWIWPNKKQMHKLMTHTESFMNFIDSKIGSSSWK